MVLKKIQLCDVVYLSGGPTPYFLNQIIAGNLRNPLSELAVQGKPFIGVSAGALICGQDIEILNSDPNEGPTTKVLTDKKGLALYDFDFWPHYQIFDEVRINSRVLLSERILYACDDSSGIAFFEGRIVSLGNVRIFSH